jgi:hypothetical protein
MDRRILEEHLAIAQAHVDTGEEYLLHQREIVSELERDGYDASQERELLALYEGMQAMHFEDRERILSELAQVA